MKTLRVLLLLAAVGCGSEEVMPAATSAEPIGLTAAVRIRGNAGDLDRLELPGVRVTVRAGDTALPVTAGVDRLDLAVHDHAWLAGTFVVPNGVQTVEVTVHFDGEGLAARGDQLTAVDAKVAPVTFTAPVAWLEQRGHAVVDLDLSRSLVELGGGYLLAPNLSVRF